MKFVMLCSRMCELFISRFSLKTTERRFPVMLLNTCFLPYVASSLNPLKEERFSTRVFQVDIHFKNGKLQSIL